MISIRSGVNTLYYPATYRERERERGREREREKEIEEENSDGR